MLSECPDCLRLPEEGASLGHLLSVGATTPSPHDRYVTYTQLRCPRCELRYLAVADSEWGCEGFCVYRLSTRAAGHGKRRYAAIIEGLPAELDVKQQRARSYAARSLAEHYLSGGDVARLEGLLVHARLDVRRAAFELCWQWTDAEDGLPALTTLLDLLRSDHVALRRQVLARLKRKAPHMSAQVPRLVAHLGSRRIDEAELSALLLIAGASESPPDLTAANSQLVAYAARPEAPAARRKRAIKLLRDCLDRSYERARSLREALSGTTDPSLLRLDRQLQAWIAGSFPAPRSEPEERWPPR